MPGQSVTARRAQTRNRLIEAALGLFAEKGVVGVTVEKICERAGFTRGAFYSNFGSKTDLCLAAFERFAKEYEETVRMSIAAVPQDIDPNISTPDLIATPLRVALEKITASHIPILAKIEIYLHFLRDPETAKLAPLILKADRLFIDMLNDVFQRANITLRMSTEQTVHILTCLLEANIIRGSEPSQVSASMAEFLEAIAVRSDPDS